MLRRPLLRLVLLLGLWLGAVAANAQPKAPEAPAPQFLSRSDTATLMAGPGAQAYFDAMHVPELLAKTRQDLRGLPLTEARERAKAHYAAEALEFSADEQALLRWSLSALWPKLTDKAPLYARTPWKFAKISDRVEGGLPHTREDTIVFGAGLMQNLLAGQRAQDLARLQVFLGYLLVHEQTHVLQRSHPELFDGLNGPLLGFVRVPAPQVPALQDSGVVNPDAPVSEWIFPLPDAPGQAVLPWLQLSNLQTPSMPRDFQMRAVRYRLEQGQWRLQDSDGRPLTEPLLEIPGYVGAFPNRSDLYHPHEIAADLLGYWLSGRSDASAQHPLRRAIPTWAAQTLK